MARPRDYLGPYRLTRLIRVGSSCAVWEAVKDEDGSEGERFALKVLLSEKAQDKDEAAYLKHELEVAKSMDHPNVIKIFEFNPKSAIPYLVLELFSEMNMKQMLRENLEGMWMNIERILDQSTQALYHMHQAGWVHRDVKPDNFLVSNEGVIKLIDFTISERAKTGLARIFGRTKVQGTRSYMSPEQIRGKAIDARSDIYSFGCVLFELLSGKLPFTASTPNELLEKHLRAPIPNLNIANTNTTDEINDLIRNMMAKTPEMRPPTMLDVLSGVRRNRIFKRVVQPTPPAAPEEDELL